MIAYMHEAATFRKCGPVFIFYVLHISIGDT